MRYEKIFGIIAETVAIYLTLIYESKYGLRAKTSVVVIWLVESHSSQTLITSEYYSVFDAYITI
jgi:hypothetical protein